MDSSYLIPLEIQGVKLKPNYKENFYLEHLQTLRRLHRLIKSKDLHQRSLDFIDLPSCKTSGKK
jgi:hypothetical protein